MHLVNWAAGRRVWSRELESVWVPFFTATNVESQTRIPHECLGAPLRLAKSEGSVKFSKSGRPVLRVVPEVREQVTLIKENFEAGLLSYAGKVQKEKKDAYKEMVEASQKAALPILEKMQADVDETIAARMVTDAFPTTPAVEPEKVAA